MNLQLNRSTPEGMGRDGDWVRLVPMEKLPLDAGQHVVCEGRALAVYRVGGEVYVFDDKCPHAGASLSGGHIRDGCVFCPWHGWSFDVGTGKCPDNPVIGVQAYPVRVVEGVVWVRLG